MKKYLSLFGLVLLAFVAMAQERTVSITLANGQTRWDYKSVSIEGDVINYSIERKIGEIPIYYAELWQPTSLSLAPVPNDIGAKIEVKRALAEQIEKSKKVEQPESDSFINQLIKKF